MNEYRIFMNDEGIVQLRAVTDDLQAYGGASHIMEILDLHNRALLRLKSWLDEVALPEDVLAPAPAKPAETAEEILVPTAKPAPTTRLDAVRNVVVALEVMQTRILGQQEVFARGNAMDSHEYLTSTLANAHDRLSGYADKGKFTNKQVRLALDRIEQRAEDVLENIHNPEVAAVVRESIMDALPGLVAVVAE